ncbi:hypothetical protein FQR65_LT10462 [Abscondita terminalis]|nr:hypothetical protein FQR65_LT10462 [Abscondita terminalis]
MTIRELQNCDFYNSTKENYFIIHGWKNSYKTESSVVIKDAVLGRTDFNVFVVDWGNIAIYNYITSQSAVKLVGEVVATFINDMVVSLKVSPKMFMLIGHSLGAHIAGCAGRGLNGSVRYIVGLDPAGPLFTLSNKDNRLDTSDAEFVQVIHTSTIFLGFSESIGHADYYPNGGKRQLGCSTDSFGGCSHARSYMYFVESILRGGFMAQACESYKQLQNGQCANGTRSYMGRIDLDTKASGNYYLHINKEAPFSIS